MVNEVGNVSGSASTPLRLSPVSVAPSMGQGRPERLSEPGVAGDQVVLSPKVSAIWGVRSDQGRLAQEIRSAQGNLAKVGDLLAGMHKTLTQITKLYPPYPADNPQRIEMLNQVEGLRKEVNALTVPPPYEFPSQADTAQLVGAALPVPARPGPVDLPAMDPAKAGSAELDQYLAKIEQAQQDVASKQQTMWQDVVRFVGQRSEAQITRNAEQVRGYLANTEGASVTGGEIRLLASAAAS